MVGIFKEYSYCVKMGGFGIELLVLFCVRYNFFITARQKRYINCFFALTFNFTVCVSVGREIYVLNLKVYENISYIFIFIYIFIHTCKGQYLDAYDCLRISLLKINKIYSCQYLNSSMQTNMNFFQTY